MRTHSIKESFIVTLIPRVIGALVRVLVGAVERVVGHRGRRVPRQAAAGVALATVKPWSAHSSGTIAALSFAALIKACHRRRYVDRLIWKACAAYSHIALRGPKVDDIRVLQVISHGY